MKITGIICEYNPLHLGHQHQLDTVRALQGADSGIVCLMSGNFVQRGAPAILDKSLRAKAAVLCGADLVLELPVTASLSSAEGFASEGVRILSPFCDQLCFGAENADAEALNATAAALLSPDFPGKIRTFLDSGMSFPAARQNALQAMGLDTSLLSQPNDILAVEYCKAILSQHATMTPLPIPRRGAYHDTEADARFPSATAVRSRMESGAQWDAFLPEAAAQCFQNAKLHAMEAGERAILARLRTMSDADFEALPYGSEGLWRKFMAACRKESSVSAILASVKSKRYTYTRLCRMMMCAYLGIDCKTLSDPAPYVRVLAFNDRGREILKLARESGDFRNAGQRTDSPWQLLEQRTDDLYGLFALWEADCAGLAQSRRVFYGK